MQLPRQLSFKRSINPSKGVFFYHQDGGLHPLQVERIKIRGSKSGYSEAYSGDKLKGSVTPFSLGQGNPHTIDTCYLPPLAESLVCRFSLRISPNALSPDKCSDNVFKDSFIELIDQYRRLDGFYELAKRYAKNILMGSWLWRNREGNITSICVKTSNGNTYNIEKSHALYWDEVWPEESKVKLDNIAKEIEISLSKKRCFWQCEVSAELKLPFCSEIYPSQCFVDNEDGNRSSKILLTTDINGKPAACFNADKIGAAIQMIDDWWDESCDLPLRVNEYGADPENLIARRHPQNNNDFYKLLMDIPSHINALNVLNKRSEIPPNIHFLMSVLVKGGMFQGGAKK